MATETPLFRLFRHKPSGRWIPYAQNTSYTTPAEEYIPELAERFKILASDVEVVETSVLPADFEDGAMVETVPESPAQAQREERGRIGLPTPEEIDQLVDQLFAAWTPAQRAYLKRLSKLVRLLT